MALVFVAFIRVVYGRTIYMSLNDLHNLTFYFFMQFILFKCNKILQMNMV